VVPHARTVATAATQPERLSNSSDCRRVPRMGLVTACKPT
jgi:hypothetical protein